MKNIQLIISFFLFNLCFGQLDLNQFNLQFQFNPKPILLYFYTDWCAYCKIQEKEIEQNKTIKTQLENDVYYLKINGESLDDINFLGKLYFAKSTQQKKNNHSFTLHFTEENEQINYPFWVIINEKQEVIGKYFGLIKNNQLYEILNKLTPIDRIN